MTRTMTYEISAKVLERERRKMGATQDVFIEYLGISKQSYHSILTKGTCGINLKEKLMTKGLPVDLFLNI